MAKRRNRSLISALKSRAVLMSLLYIIVGVLFIVFRTQMLNVMMTIVGVLFIIYGVADLLVTHNKTVSGILGIAVGVVILVCGSQFTTIVLIIFGVYLAIQGAIILLESIRHNNLLGTLFACLAIVVGIMLIIGQWFMVDWFFIVMGAVFIIDGFVGLVQVLKH